ncbi:hypothetical protein B9Z31_10560 [Limnohabitans sp. G3-2]|nr:hypothetical protein B9Z31_10560 [Limnohabitans sp. G3-2]
MTATLELPDNINRSAQRVLHNGAIRYRLIDSKIHAAYVDDVIESHFYDVDGRTVLFVEVVDDVSAPVRLSGPVGNNDIFNRQYDLFQLPVAAGIDPNTNWNNEAAYTSIKSYHRDPMLAVVDWSSPTFDAQVNAYAGPESAVENFFATHPIWSYGGNSYGLNSGTIVTVQGARAWVATTPLPSASYPTTAYRAMIELGQRLYVGIYYPANTRLRYRDQIDPSQQIDYRVVLNPAALVSMKQAMSF